MAKRRKRDRGSKSPGAKKAKLGTRNRRGRIPQKRKGARPQLVGADKMRGRVAPSSTLGGLKTQFASNVARIVRHSSYRKAKRASSLKMSDYATSLKPRVKKRATSSGAVRSHQRRLSSGKVIQVREYNRSR